MAKTIPIDERIIIQSAKATIKNLINGIVELVTNSDDSYRRLEQNGNEVKGEIQIYVNRKKGGTCERLTVKDLAEGMTKDQLEKAILFGGETSGFSEGKSVRGLFGRGLKETIIALGEGEIRSVKDNKLYRTKLWIDEREKKPKYDDELLNEVQHTEEKNGTTIDIKITNENIKIPELEKFKEQLSQHYSLRDITSSNRRRVSLIFEDLKRKMKDIANITFSYPEGMTVFEKEVQLSNYGDNVKITIYESLAPLETPRNNPYGLAGILIKTKSSILDNQLFKFDNDPASYYFWGEAMCYDLEERIRNGETEIIDFNRGGLSWNSEYCKELSSTIEKILEPLVLEKRNSLREKPLKEIKEPTKKLLRKLCSLLNELAKREYDEIEVPIPQNPDPNIKQLTIKPEVANIPLDVPRSFSIYAPLEIVGREGSEVYIECDNPLDIKPLASVVKLEKHPKYAELCYKPFKVVGKTENSEGYLIVTLGDERASAKVKVAPPKKRKKGILTGRKGGFVSDIEIDMSISPRQRTFYDRNRGVIKIFVNFPSVKKFVKSGLEGVQREEGKILLAELVGEAFCKELARLRLETNPPPPGGEIDAFNDEVNKIQKDNLYLIQELIFNWKFKEQDR